MSVQPVPHTSNADLEQFVGAVLRMRPRLAHLVDTRLSLYARACISKN